jgi:toxin FitB
MYIFDTNVVSELRKLAKSDPRVSAWSSSIPIARTYLSAITILEIEIGILRIARKDKAQAVYLRTWLDNQVLVQFDGRILPVDVLVAKSCATLHVPNPRPDRDAYIAATALVHGMTVVTRNVADFAPTGVRVFNPWD